MPDALHGRAAVWAGLAVAAVHGHVRPEGRDALGEFATRGLPQPHDPVVERCPRGIVEPRVLAVAQRTRLPHRREPRAMQDLVRVRIPDAGEDVRVGQRALERVILARDGVAEFRLGAGERLDPAGVERDDRRLALQEMNRRALLRPGLGQRERARREVQGRQPELAGHLRAWRFPVKAPGDHQVDRQEEIALEGDDDALAHAAEPGDRWLRRSADRTNARRTGSPASRRSSDLLSRAPVTRAPRASTYTVTSGSS